MTIRQTFGAELENELKKIGFTKGLNRGKTNNSNDAEITNQHHSPPGWREEPVGDADRSRIDESGRSLAIHCGEDVNLEGHYPLLKTMFYTLDVDFEQNKVGIWYGPEQAKLATCKLSASDVAYRLRRWHEQITEHVFTDEAFIRDLYAIVGYQERMSIPDLVTGYIKRIGSMSKKTARIFLSYDLYRLKTRIVDGDELSLVTATRAYTQRKSDFLWIPTDDRGHGNYISHIRFRRINPIVADIKSDIDAAVKKVTA